MKCQYLLRWDILGPGILPENVNLVKLKVTKNQDNRLTTWENIQNQKIEGHAVPPPCTVGLSLLISYDF